MTDHEHVNEYVLKIVLILLNILSNLTGQVIYLSPLDSKINAKAAIGILGGIIVLYIIFSIGVIFTTLAKFKRKKSKKEVLVSIIAHSITAVAGVMYLVGDDIPTILVLYSNEFECDEDCRLVFQAVGRALLITAVLFFRLTPSFVNKSTVVANEVSNNEHISRSSWSPWKAVAQSVALIVELDAWFSAVAELPLDTDIFCPAHELLISWVLYGVSLVVWAVLLLLILAPGIIKGMKKCQENVCKMFATFCVFVVIWFCSAILILADNTQPIGCLFNCDIYVSTDNRTESTDTCNTTGYYGITIFLLTLVLILLSTISVALLIHWVKKICKPSTVVQHDSATIKEDGFDENNGQSHEDNENSHRDSGDESHKGKNESHGGNEESQGGDEEFHIDHKESQGGNEESHGDNKKSQGNEESQGGDEEFQIDHKESQGGNEESQ